MTPFLRDGYELEQHRELKRRDFVARASAWKKRKVETKTSALPCFWQDSVESLITLRSAHLLRLFTDGFSLVRYVEGPGVDPGYFVLRDGIPWDQWMPKLLERYENGFNVPESFRPKRRLPPDWVEKAKQWDLASQIQWFEKLRVQGLLPHLNKLDESSLSPWIRWDEVRSRFLDFRVSTSLGAENL